MSRVAILGAGIMGAATALFLARRGVAVTLFDRAAAPLGGASRWNEGKIHLGYLYAGDRTLATARLLIPGGLAFRPLVEELIDGSIAPAISEQTDVYAIHRDSVVDADAAAAYYEAVAALVAAAPMPTGYLGDAVSPPSRLSGADLSRDYDPDCIVAAFRVSERSVDTTWIADRLGAALAAERLIEVRLGVEVIGVRARRDDGDALHAPLTVDTAQGADGPFDAVVNALWEGRLAVDATLGIPPPPRWSHRYRLALFLRLDRPVVLPSTVVATGPFGDVKNYDGHRLYLSWYPEGLRAEGLGLQPPAVPALDGGAQRDLAEATIARLGALVPSVRVLAPFAAHGRIAGGWVYAAGQGSLADPQATLHRRADAGIQRFGRYLTVDTGKYSIAPWLAQQVANALL